ncbi:hypothetical protein CMI47_21960 [Candidatus Pacearchaeota archaeon]|nr:hypothetical protein [Candidatus Pacearchaeota archaeon]
MNEISLSKRTLEILKNFSTINSNILIEPGSNITTISPVKNVMAEAVVEETFDVQFGLWDLNKFLGVVSLFDSPKFMFGDNCVTISESNKGNSVRYYYSDPRLLTTVNKKINMPSSVVDFQLKHNDFTDLQKAASILQVADLAVKANGDELIIEALDKKDITTNTYSISLGDLPTDYCDFTFYFKAENLKLLLGSYDVSISEKVVSQFKHQNVDLTYWIALESDSYYNT